MTNFEESLSVVGCPLTIKTQNEELQGQVFAFDKASNTVLLTQSGSTPFHSNLRLLKVDYIKVLDECPCVTEMRVPLRKLQWSGY